MAVARPAGFKITIFCKRPFCYLEFIVLAEFVAAVSFNVVRRCRHLRHPH